MGLVAALGRLFCGHEWTLLKGEMAFSDVNRVFSDAKPLLSDVDALFSYVNLEKSD
jgi:hypothetical protein